MTADLLMAFEYAPPRRPDPALRERPRDVARPTATSASGTRPSVSRSRFLWILFLAGCTNERWVFGPTASEALEVDEGVQTVEGEAVLAYDRAGFPADEEIVSNALRLEARSSAREAVVLEFPDADPADTSGFEGEPGMQNLHGVYERCDEARCEIVVPFRVTREQVGAAVIEVSGDAILSVESVVHRTDPARSDASLDLRFR